MIIMKMVVIGIGSFGKNHIRDLKELGHEVITCDVDKRFNPDFQDYKKMDLDNIDGVIIATPASTHYDIAKYILERCRHVLVEKPMTMNYKQAIELVEIAENNKLIFAVGHIFRYNSVTKRLITELQRVIQEGQDIFAIRSQRIGLHSPRTDCGVVWDYAVHDIDLIDFILNNISIIYDIQCKTTFQGHPLGTNNEDIASINYNIQNIIIQNQKNYKKIDDRINYKIFVQIDVDWINPVKNRTLTFICSNETIEADFVKEELRIHKSGLFPGEGEPVFSTKMGDTIIPKIMHEEPLKKELEDFIYCIKNDTKPISNARSCLPVIKFIDSLIRFR